MDKLHDANGTPEHKRVRPSRRRSSSDDSGERISPKKLIRRNNPTLKKSFADDFHLNGAKDFPLGNNFGNPDILKKAPKFTQLIEETKHELKEIGQELGFINSDQDG